MCSLFSCFRLISTYPFGLWRHAISCRQTFSSGFTPPRNWGRCDRQAGSLRLSREVSNLEATLCLFLLIFVVVYVLISSLSTAARSVALLNCFRILGDAGVFIPGIASRVCCPRCCAGLALFVRCLGDWRLGRRFGYWGTGTRRLGGRSLRLQFWLIAVEGSGSLGLLAFPWEDLSWCLVLATPVLRCIISSISQRSTPNVSIVLVYIYKVW